MQNFIRKCEKTLEKEPVMADADSDKEDMGKEDRKEYFEELGIEPKKVEEHDKKEDGIDVIDDTEGEEKKEERREEELEQYREVSGF